ncbi:exo-alpha-sialidase [Sphingobacterium humi]|uniref:Exo-alpha-sialidase n=1 Tax=Sphingobacterium humi TaxID=1796905 RepID=A0A6N8KVN2_9SPHI|nr:exo-alpha-sialidase [Sphingobacterium humi]MVZ60769.1 exo-alpha-sialidase [Sphingobacterium humi]
MKDLLLSLLCLCVVFVVHAQQNKFTVLNRAYIFPHQAQHVHGSSIVELPSGNLLATWFQGSGERGADDVKIMGAKYNMATQKWGSAYLLADTEGLPDCNPVFFMHQQKLYLVWIAVQANRWENSVLKFRRASDFEGNEVKWEWQDNILLKPGDDFVAAVKKRFKELPAQHHAWAEYAPRYDAQIMQATEDPTKRAFGWMTRIKPLILKSGRILLPIYSDGFNFSMIAFSDSHGESWKYSEPIVGRGNIQPALIENSKGEILAYMRDSGDDPALLQSSISKDKGLTWAVNKELPVKSTASVDVLKLGKNNWILLTNDMDEGRARLSLYQSKDEGANWNSIGIIVEDKNKVGRFSYPAMILAENGHIHITYSHHKEPNSKTIEHVIIDAKSIQ